MASGSGTTWSKEETLKLIDVWGEETIQKQLQECKRNQAIYEAVAQEMREAGYDRTYQQCRDKIKKLRAEYKKEKDKQGKTGEGRTTWEFFDALDAILGTRPSTRPPIVVDTSEATDTTADTQETEQDDREDANQREDSEPPSLNSSTQSTASAAPTQPSSKKRKKSKSDGVVVDLIEKVISAQNKNDERILELEEKRMKMEERQLEREAQQRREDREFQMQMMRMMMGSGMYHFPPPPNQPSLGQHTTSDQSSASFAFGSRSNMYDYASGFDSEQ